MRLVRLKAVRFGCVESAAVEFGPGLNVLFGPNDLGKSSLADAIRFALLLQHGSSESEAFVPWREDAAPEVELVFATEPQTFWRIRKSFGKGNRGSSMFEFSKDGVSFTNDAKGREVDAEIRKHLRWGIPEPGGKGAPRGLPESFLTTVLLARQDNVTELFGRHLGNDQSDSGKKLLTEALQAVAQDPLFLAVLQRTQAKVEEAFTPAGAFRRAKGAPFTRLKELLKQAEDDYQSLQRQVVDSESARDRVREVSERLVFEEEERRLAHEALGQIDAIVAKDAEVQTCRAEVERIKSLWTKASEAAAERGKLTETLERAEAALRALLAEIAALEARTSIARRDIETLESNEGAQQQLLRKGALEKEIAELGAEREKLSNQRERAHAVRNVDERLSRLHHELESLADQVSASEKDICDRDGVVERARADLQRHRGIRLWIGREEFLDRIDKLRGVVRQKEALERRAADLDQTSSTLQNELGRAHIPERREVEILRELERSMLLAEAALDVGLLVELQAHSALEFVQAGPPIRTTRVAPGETTTFEGGREIRFSLPGIADFVLRGGRADARANAEQARTAYESLARALFARTEASSIPGVEAAIQAACDRRNQLTRCLAEAETVRAQAESLGAGDQDLATLESRLADCERQLEPYPRETLAQQAKGLGPAQLTAVETEIANCEKLVDQATARRNELEAELAARKASAVALQAAVAEANEARARAVSELGQSWQEILKVCEHGLDAASSRLEKAESDLQGLGVVEQERLRQARDQLVQAEQAMVAASEQRTERERKVEALRQRVAELSGEVKVRKETADREDLSAANETLKRLTIERDAMSRPPGVQSVNAMTRQDAIRRLADVEGSLRNLRAELHAAEGALCQVGGDIARERCQGALAALEKYRDHERALELEYNAWRLLLNTLKDAERDQAAHLGESIVEPIARRFGELAGSRYGELDLGPALETGGIHAAGESRDISRLSVGTREQLSTIFRLSLAEQLRSAILLDDQLTQSDPQRMSWFKQRLRELASTIQIIVLTCRPDDYLLEGERPTDGEVFENGPIRALNLERLIRRAT